MNYLLQKFKSRNDKSRLNNFKRYYTDINQQEKNSEFESQLKEISYANKINTRLIQAGFISAKDQIKIIRYRNILLILISTVIFFGFLWLGKGIIVALSFAFLSLYLVLMLYFAWIRYQINKTERLIYYDTPLFLEELVLLIESGLALFSALQELTLKKNQNKGVVQEYMKKVYRIASSGLPVTEAFTLTAKDCPFKPIRHVLLQLDVSSSVGGELIYALQSLANQVHQEWKLAVETRVKKLENLVVFPVFAAVLGMMVLTAAVPMVPILDFMNTLKKMPNVAQQESDNLLINKSIN